MIVLALALLITPAYSAVLSAFSLSLASDKLIQHGNRGRDLPRIYDFFLGEGARLLLTVTYNTTDPSLPLDEALFLDSIAFVSAGCDSAAPVEASAFDYFAVAVQPQPRRATAPQRHVIDTDAAPRSLFRSLFPQRRHQAPPAHTQVHTRAVMFAADVYTSRHDFEGLARPHAYKFSAIRVTLATEDKRQQFTLDAPQLLRLRHTKNVAVHIPDISQIAEPDTHRHPRHRAKCPSCGELLLATENEAARAGVARSVSALSFCNHWFHTTCLERSILGREGDRCPECSAAINKPGWYPFANHVNWEKMDPMRKITWEDIQRVCRGRSA